MALFTRETAASMSAKGNAARWSRWRAEREKTANPPKLEPIISDGNPTFAQRKLARIRDQIDRVERLLDDADEPQAVDRFANALTRLYDLERILDGRPLPGSRKPAPERATRDAQPGAWLNVEAVQVQAPQAPSSISESSKDNIASANQLPQPTQSIEQPLSPTPPAAPAPAPERLPGNVTP